MTTTYGYDPVYELLSATQGGTTTESYTYDPVGNRTASLSIPSYTVNTSNELTSDSNASYTYDNNGNTLTKVVGSNSTSYAWDFENRLTSVTLPDTGGTVQFKYDPFGRRIEKVSTTATSIFAYDGDSLIETTNGSGFRTAGRGSVQNEFRCWRWFYRSQGKSFDERAALAMNIIRAEHADFVPIIRP